MDKLDWLLDRLACSEQPMGICWTNVQPKGGYSPTPGKGHDCILKYMRLARKTGRPGWISRANAACRGGAIYAGFAPPQAPVAQYVSQVERYLPSEDSMWRFFEDLDMRPELSEYCVFKPLGSFEQDERPQVAAFFARGEVLSGLCQLACFALDDHDAVAIPFGSGCANILSWPRAYAQRGQQKAVLGGVDPSCRPYMGQDEWTFAVTIPVLERMLDAARDSFLAGKTWDKVLQKIRRK